MEYAFKKLVSEIRECYQLQRDDLLTIIYWCSQNFFVTVRAGTAYREMKMLKECIFCMLVLQKHIINHCVPRPSGNFSRQTVRMYKNPGDQNMFPKNWVERNFFW